jgi:hypothetical protein
MCRIDQVGSKFGVSSLAGNFDVISRLHHPPDGGNGCFNVLCIKGALQAVGYD